MEPTGATGRTDLFGGSEKGGGPVDGGDYSNRSGGGGYEENVDLDDCMELEHVIGYTGHFLDTMHHHPQQPNVFIAPMGSDVVVGDINDPHKQVFLRGHDEEVSSVAFSPTGALCASGQLGSTSSKDNDAPVIVWDFANKRELYQLLGHIDGVLRLAFSPDERYLAASGQDCKVHIWDMTTGEMVTGKKAPSPVSLLTWGGVVGSGRRPTYNLVTAFASQVICDTLAYDMRTMQYGLSSEQCQMPPTGLVREYHVSRITTDGDFFLAGTAGGDFVVFSMGSKVFRASVPVSNNGVLSMCVSSLSGDVYVGCGDGMIKKMAGRDDSWELLAEVKVVGKVVSLSLNHDSSELLAGTSTGTMHRVMADDLSVREIAASHVSCINGVAFGADNDVFGTVSKDGTVRVWELSEYSLVAQNTEPVEGLCLAFGDRVLVSGWEDGFMRGYDPSSGYKQWEIPNAHREAMTAVAVNDKCYVSGGRGGAVRVWKADATRALLAQFAEHKQAVTKVIIDNQMPWLIHSCGLDRATFTYDLKTERRTVTHQNREGSFNSMAQRIDSEQELVTVGGDGLIHFWDCDVREPVYICADPNQLSVSGVSISPSGRFLATCGKDAMVKIYDLANQMMLVSVKNGHSGPVMDLEWSPDERQLISVGSECCICIYNFYGLDAAQYD
jgi:WD40 repeat protein